MASTNAPAAPAVAAASRPGTAASTGSGVSSGYLLSLMENMEAHRRGHEAQARGETAPGESQGDAGGYQANCIQLLQKLKSVLPKLMRAYYNPKSSSCEDVAAMCRLLGMVLSREMCEHAEEVFEHGKLRVVAPRIFTTLRLLVDPRFLPARSPLLGVAARLLNLVQTSDLAAHERLFADLVQLLEDGLRLLGLLLSAPADTQQRLLTPETRLFAFQGTLQRVASGEPQHQPPATATADTITTTQANNSNNGLDADSAALPLPTAQSVLLLLDAATRVLRAMLLPSEVLAASPAAAALGRALGRQLLLTAHARVGDLSSPSATMQEDAEGDGWPSLAGAVRALRRHTVEALSALLAASAGGVPEGVKAELVGAALRLAQGQLALLLQAPEEEEEEEGQDDARLCDVPTLAALLRCLLGLLGADGDDDSGHAALLPAATPGVVAALRLCLAGSTTTTDNDSNPEADPSRSPRRRLIRHALLHAFRRVLLASPSAARHLPVLQDAGPAVPADRHYLADVLACWTAALRPQGPHRRVARGALAAWVGETGGFTGARRREAATAPAEAATTASSSRRKRPRAAAAGGGGAAASAAASSGRSKKKRHRRGEASGFGEDEDEQEEEGEEAAGGPASGHEGAAAMMGVATAAVPAASKASPPLAGAALVVWRLLWATLDRAGKALGDLERLGQARPTAQGLRAWQRGMQASAMQASLGLQLAVLLVGGEETEKGDGDGELLSHVYHAAARLLRLLPTHDTDIFLRCAAFPHLPLNAALAFAGAFPLGGGGRGLVGEEDGGRRVLRDAVGTTALAVLTCLGKPSHVAVMLAEPPDAAFGGPLEPLVEQEEEALGAALGLGWLDKALVLLCCAATLNAEAAGECDAALAACVQEQIDDADSAALVLQALERCAPLARVLTLLAAEGTDRRVAVRLLRALPLLLEAAAHDDYGEGKSKNPCPLALLATACLAVGHRLLAWWTAPEDPSWSDPADPAVPALGCLLLRLVRLLDAAYPARVALDAKGQQVAAPLVLQAKPALGPAPRVRLRPACLRGRDLLDGAAAPPRAGPLQQEGDASATVAAAPPPAELRMGGDDEAEDEDLGLVGACPAPHLAVVLQAALPLARPLLEANVNPWARAAAAKAFFRLLAMAPATDLHGRGLRAPAHAVCVRLWGLLGDAHQAVRVAAAERVVALMADGGKLAQLVYRRDGTAALATAPARPRSRQRGRGRSSPASGLGPGEEPPPEGNPSEVDLELAITDLTTRFKEALKLRVLLVEGEAPDEEAAAALAAAAAAAGPNAPFLLGALLQACGAVAMRLPPARLHEMLYLWIVIHLAEVWAARGVCASFAYEQLVRVARRGRMPLEPTLALNAWEVLPRLLRSLVGQGMLEDFVTEVLPEERSPRHFLQLALKYAVAACVQDEAEGELEGLAAVWARHVEPGLRTFTVKDPAQRAAMTPVTRMLLELGPDVVPRILVDGPGRIEFFLRVGALSAHDFTLGTLLELGDQNMFCEVLWEMGLAEDRGDGARLTQAKGALGMLVVLRRQTKQQREEQQQQGGDGDGEDTEDEAAAAVVAPAAGRSGKKKKKGGGGAEEGAGDGEGEGGGDVADFVAANFLFAISKSILPVDWETRAARRNAVAMRCLRLMLELMGAARVPAFLPKILSIMKTMLWEDAGGRASGDGRGGGVEVREMACHVMKRFAHALPDAELRANLSVLVVTLLPAVVPFARWAGDDASWCGDEDGSGSSGPGPLPADSPGRAILLQLLHWLLVTKRPALEPAFASIPFLPDLPELAEARAVFAEAVLPENAPLSLHLRRLLPLLAHASPDVRYASLRQLRATLRGSPDALSLLVLGSDTAEDVVSELLTALLRVAASEDKTEALAQACCACLGELGAIDPARVAAVALFEGGPSARRASRIYPPLPPGSSNNSNGSGGNSGAGDDAAQSELAATWAAAAAAAAAAMPPPLLAPWRANDSLLALVLLQYLLVPKLRAAATDKDRYPYAVQELLHHIWRRGAVRLWEEEEGPPLPPAGAEDEDDEEVQVVVAAPEPAAGRRATRRNTRASAAAASAATAGQEGKDGEPPQEEDGRQLAAVGGSKARGPMPAWLEWSLGRCGVLDTVRPFWSTNYMVNRAQSPRGPPFFATGQSFEFCLGSLVRYLIERARGPFADVIYCVRGLVSMHHALPHFLLPYLVAETWCFGADEDKAMLVREVLFVLERRPTSSRRRASGGAAGFGAGAGGPRRTDSDDHVATQAVLSLLDTLTEWCSASSAASASKKKKASAMPAAVAEADSAEGEGLWDKSMLPVLREFLAQMPPLLLIRASMRIRAHTRALKYLEALVRERAMQDRERTAVAGEGGDASSASHPGGAASSASYPSSASHGLEPLGGPTALALLSPTAVTDGANNTLPLLESGEVDLFQRIFARLDEPDSMTGLAAARRKAGRPTTARQRIREYEHAEEWSHALQGYEQALQELEQRYQQQQEGTGAGAEGAMAVATTPEEEGTTTAAVEGEAAEAAQLSRGLLQSLLEMEQNESAVNQFLGMVARRPALRPHLLPLGAEACWRLQQWPALQEILQQTGSSSTKPTIGGSPTLSLLGGGASGNSSGMALGADERFQLALGRVLLGLQARDTRRFAGALRAARSEAMATLSAASVESYQRAYPSLVRLHILHELEQGFELLRATGPAVVLDGGDDADATEDEMDEEEGGAGGRGRDSDHDAARSGAATQLLGKWQWDRRLAAMSTSVRACAPVVAARRTLFHMGRLRSLLAENWAATAARAAEAGRFRLAESALRQGACLGLEGERLVLEEAKLLHAQERVHEALLLLEPVETDLAALKLRLTDLVRHGSHAVAQDARRRAATRLLLATDWMVEAGVKHGQAVLERYKLAQELQPKAEACYFALARYTDFLLEARRKEIASLSSASETVVTGGGAAAAKAAREAALAAAAEDELLHGYITKALEHYGHGLQHGLDSIFQALPRFLTLFFEVGDMAEAAAKAAASGAISNARRAAQQQQGATLAEKLLQQCCLTMRRTVQKVAACAWYTALPQLLAQVGQPEARQEVQQLVMEAVVKVLETHPEQAMWATTGLTFSRDPGRKRAGEKILRTACQRLQEGEGGDADDMAMMLQDSRRLFHELIDLARSQEEPGPDRRLRVNIGRRFPLIKFLVPVQAALTVSLRVPGHAGGAGGGGLLGGGGVGGGGFVGGGARRTGFGGGGLSQGGDFLMPDAFYDAFPNAQMQIRMFGDAATVMRSKAKPKRITVHTTCGRVVTFLCKTERSGDLRKDARLMEFNGIVNRLLQRDAEGRRRRLRLRTYAVVCLNEESGLMEWVPNTAPLRNCVYESQRAAAEAGVPASAVPRQPFSELRQHFEHGQTAYRDNLPKMAAEYREHVLAKQPPTFHHWFLAHFPEPTAWFEARTAFTRSAAVWSALGHVVGLGDRHGENILLDTANGECVHVDFDCLFDKGLTLQRPEVVPFRLTPNMVDAMGVTGYEGPYRKVMEVCLGVLREHRQTLLSVLDPFLSDPTVGWDHMNRAYQQPQLTIIDERLRGIYNLRVPVRHSRSRGGGSRGRDEAAAAAVASAAGGKDVALPLSVPGQVQKLIFEATSLENLAQMYVGWMPWC